MSCSIKKNWEDCEPSPDEDGNFEVSSSECEQRISERFDEEVLPLVIEQYGEDDQPAIDEAFNDWTDSLCKNKEICSYAYSVFEYVGKHSNQ